MEHVFFKPYVGENYKNGYSGKKLLILGDSHYCEGKLYNNRTVLEECGRQEDECLRFDGCENFTSVVVNRFIDYKEGKGKHEFWMNTYTKFTNVFFGEKVDNEDLLEFWDCIMFFNYIQRPMLEKRQRPTEQDFVDGQIPFYEILKEYRPDLVFVWGFWLRDRLTNGRTWHSTLLGKEEQNLYYYNIDGKKIKAYAIPHPSTPRYFNYWYHDFLQEALRIS